MEDSNNKSQKELSGTISHIESKLELFKRIQELVDSLPEEDDVFISDPPDSHEVTVRVITDNPSDELAELSEIDHGNGRVEYSPKSGEYSLYRKFKDY